MTSAAAVPAPTRPAPSRLAPARRASSGLGPSASAGARPSQEQAAGKWRFAPGEEVATGRHVLALLGGGNRYEAYLAWDERLGSPVVAKLLRPHLVSESRALEAITREAAALSELQHPVLVRSFGAALSGERPHLVLEFLDGPRLSTLVRKFGPLSSEQVVPLARQLASALHYMAGGGWVHLDVKPRNIVMTASPRLIDLSVARRMTEIPGIKGPVGTDAYMAPEQCDPDRFGEIGPASDVWAMGVTVYEALTGRRPFPTVPGQRFPQLRSAPPGMPDKAPPALGAAIESALSPDPRARPTASEFYDLLERLADWAHSRARKVR